MLAMGEFLLTVLIFLAVAVFSANLLQSTQNTAIAGRKAREAQKSSLIGRDKVTPRSLILNFLINSR